MKGFSSVAYDEAKKWVSAKITEGATWDEAKFLFTSEEKAYDEFSKQRDEELTIPYNMEFEEWPYFIAEMKKNYSPIIDPYGISVSPSNTLPIPTDTSSPWVQYKNYLLGQKDGKRRMSDAAIAQIEKNSHWILNHLLKDTRSTGARKGLVMGSVQSGKTANMIGLASMAAHYDWNFIIILSGMIENLRKQTRDRFMKDLLGSWGKNWHILDKTGKSDYLVDLETNERLISDSLSLNSFQKGGSQGKWLHRYVTVCLKNSTRLKNLINWLHANPARAARMRILVIDDEADQASINAKKMNENITDPEMLERASVNQLIIDLVNGRNADGTVSNAPFQAMNYVSFTATPYANVLNEAYEMSLYPKDFICSLPESDEYFGAKVIFGSDEDENFPGLDIVRVIPKEELKEIKTIHKGATYTLPEELKKSVCWFLCSAAILRNRGHKNPISMLIHTTNIQNGHFEEYEALRGWLIREGQTGSILSLCHAVYEAERDRLTLEKLRECYSTYGRLDEVNGDFPPFEELIEDISLLCSNIGNILMGDEGSQEYSDDYIHLCVDNCRANRMAEDGTYLRIVYPTDEKLNAMKRAPVFIIMGGNTLSRGLTIEGLVCTYFARNSNLADSLMQMARWFGYRRGYELLQRIWMPVAIQEKFHLLEKIDEKLKAEFEDFVEKGRDPAKFGPKIINSATIARFLLTSKNKSQNAIECDFDFSGDSHETTKFEDNSYLQHNIDVTEHMLQKLGPAVESEIGSAFVWRNVNSSLLMESFFSSEKYHIYEDSSLSNNIHIFCQWMQQMNNEGRYLKWNVAIAGDGRAQSKWICGNASVGKIERSKKSNLAYIDIGSLRSGLDAICDIREADLSPEQKKLLEETRKRKKNIISNRGGLGMEDTPLLLLYRIDKDLGKESKKGLKVKLDSSTDIIGFSIIIAGEPSGGTYARALTVAIPE